MLPVALTCPLWWVARWAARLLTSLGLLGSLALPAAAAAPLGAPAAGVDTSVDLHTALGRLGDPGRLVVVAHVTAPDRAVLVGATTDPHRSFDDSVPLDAVVPGASARVAGDAVTGPEPDVPPASLPAASAPRAPPGA
ncbi:hypothetical protein [Micromonospora sp. URMC 103]|uniref:hypothetical protein n=1 Tax=Micromonospora sp. URMC 103 TaxID=3423406 RepID=UPI003F1DD0DC